MGHQKASFFTLFDACYPKIHLFSPIQPKKTFKTNIHPWFFNSSDVVKESDEKPLVKVNALIKRGALHIQKCQGD